MQPREGMIIKTNTPALRKHRKMVLELLLANHCRDCTTCLKSGNCKLQKFAVRYKLEDIRFPNYSCSIGGDKSSDSIVRTPNKCILCGKCVRVCEEVQNVGAIHYAHRGADMKISTAFDGKIADSPCVGCGQCAVVCPTGAIVVKDDADKVLDAIGDENTYVSVQIAPAVRVALGKQFGVKEGENLMGKSPEKIQYFMEVRGIGVINVQKMYGPGAIRPKKTIDLLIELVRWDDSQVYDRLGDIKDNTDVLGIMKPKLTIPVSPGRNIPAIIETAARKYRLDQDGYDATAELLKRSFK
jgi:ferredoxin